MEFRQGGPWHEPKPSDEGGILQPIESRIDVLHVTTKTPYKQVNFWGTYVATGAGAMAAYGGFVMPATSIALINADLGPQQNYYWVILSWTLCLAIGYTLVGRLSDIFGRRWFFIGATAIATIGCAIGATAGNINTLIGAMALIGLATSAQLSFNYTLTELVPIKHRFFVLTGIFLIATPFSCFGPYISRIWIATTQLGWRWDFYANLIANGISLICYMAFYHPPDFAELHDRRRTQWQELQELDYIGIFLYSLGLLLFLMGLSWGGNLYPWGSAHVVATLVIGILVTIVFIIYESHIPLKRPLIPMHLFRNVDYVVLTTVSAVGGMLYYSLNVVYPIMVSALFTTDIVEQGLLTVALGGGVALGQFGASLVATPGGFLRWKIFASVLLSTVFTAALAGAKTKEAATGLVIIASIGVGALESFAGVAVTIVIKDQTEIGAAAGAYGSIRSAAGVFATAILTTVLADKSAAEIQAIVAPALAKAGLPLSSIADFIGALVAGDITAAEKVPGFKPAILDIAALTMEEAFSKTFTVVYLVTLSWGILSCIAAFFTPSIEDLYTDEVMRQLRDGFGQEREPEHHVEAYSMGGYEHKGQVFEHRQQLH